MGDTLLANERVIRLGFFLGVFAMMLLWEGMAPRKPGIYTFDPQNITQDG